MKYAFLISGLVELLGGLVCEFYPHLIFGDFDAWMTSLFGLSIIVIGITNLLAFRYYKAGKLFKGLFLAMLFYHGAVAMIIQRAPVEVISYRLPALLLHLGLFLCFMMAYLGGLKPDTDTTTQ